jgi:hypothetical protein
LARRHIQLKTVWVARMNQQQSAVRAGDVNLLHWAQWQHSVVALLRADVIGVLHAIEVDEVDWDAWRSFYSEGRSPRSAIDRALARDF